jgi:hypothetical protein
MNEIKIDLNKIDVTGSGPDAIANCLGNTSYASVTKTGDLII